MGLVCGVEKQGESGLGEVEGAFAVGLTRSSALSSQVSSSSNIGYSHTPCIASIHLGLCDFQEWFPDKRSAGIVHRSGALDVFTEFLFDFLDHRLHAFRI